MKVVLAGNYDRAFLMCRTALLSGLVRAGHEVVVCAPEETPGVVDALRAMGVGFRGIGLNRTGTNPLADLRTFLEFRTLFRELRPDMVVSYTIKPVIYASLAARLCGVARIFSVITGLGFLFTGDAFRQRTIRRLTLPLYRRALSYNSRIFFLNSDDMALFAGLGLKAENPPVLLDGEGIDTEFFSPAEPPPETGGPVFLMIARLLRDKGVYEFVEAARILKRRHPQAVFRLLGPLDPNPTAVTRAQVEEWRREGAIEYLGETRDVRPYLAAAGAYVLPSYREGLPLTIMEAMAMGLPVVTTDVPGCRQTVADGDNGFVVPARDPEALARAMERFVLQPELVRRMGRRSREIAQERYDARKVGAAMMRGMEVFDETDL